MEVPMEGDEEVENSENESIGLEGQAVGVEMI